jgi:hypothetical protein
MKIIIHEENREGILKTYLKLKMVFVQKLEF